MFYYKFILFFTVSNLYAFAEKDLHLLCGDANCSVLIAECNVERTHHSSSKDRLSLSANDAVEIYGRDDKEKLFLGKVKGKSKLGLVSSHYCRITSEPKKIKELVSGKWPENSSEESTISKAANDKSGNVGSESNANETDPVENSSNAADNLTLVESGTNSSDASKNDVISPPIQNPKVSNPTEPPKNVQFNDKGPSKPSKTEESGVEAENKETTSSSEDGVTVEDASSNEVDNSSTPSKDATPDASQTGGKTETHGSQEKKPESTNPTGDTTKETDKASASQNATSENSTDGFNLGSSDNKTFISGSQQNTKLESTSHTGVITKETDNQASLQHTLTSVNDIVTPENTNNGTENGTSISQNIKPESATDEKADNETTTTSGQSNQPSSGSVQDNSVDPTLQPPAPTPNFYKQYIPTGIHKNIIDSSAKSAQGNLENSLGKDTGAFTTHVPTNEMRSGVTAEQDQQFIEQSNVSNHELNKTETPAENTQSQTELNLTLGKPEEKEAPIHDHPKQVDLKSSTLNIQKIPIPDAPETVETEQNASVNQIQANHFDGLKNTTEPDTISVTESSTLYDGESTTEHEPKENADPSKFDKSYSEVPSYNAQNKLYPTEPPAPLQETESVTNEPNDKESNSEVPSYNAQNVLYPTEQPAPSQETKSVTNGPNDKESNSEVPSYIAQNEYPTEQPALSQEIESVTNEPNDKENESSVEDLNEAEPSESWYSSILSYMPAFDSLLTSSPNTFNYEKPETFSEIHQPQESSEKHEYYPSSFDGEEYCAADNSWISMKTTSWLVFTSVVILVFSLGYYYMENSKRDLELVIKNNDLASELFILQKERTVLEERLLDAEFTANAKSGEHLKEVVESLQNEIDQAKEEKRQLSEREQSLVKKCAMLEANYAKLRQMFAENKQKGERSALIADIKKLKESSSNEIASLKDQLEAKTEEIKTLSVNLHKSNEAKGKLEDKLNLMMADEQMAIQNYQDSVSKLEQTIEESKATVMILEDEVGKLKKDCESLKIEKELAETALQKAHGLKSSESLSSWLDSREIRVSLASAEREIEELKEIKGDLEKKQNSLVSKVEQLQNELKDLNEKYETAEKDKIEALTKLQVLSDYFNEKETQLQEELGLKEALWLQKQSDDHTIYEQMRTLREENQTYKSQNDTLKKEIIDQESSYKKLIASAEEKADGYWVSLRQAERRLKETQIEASQLRSRLTAIETSEHNLTDDKMMKGEMNGDMPPFGPTTSPPFMMYPGEFIPPPPLIPVTPSRPPPLGRISSPPLGDFTPPLPLPFDLYPPSPPPPPLQHLHRPQPREPPRKQKESQSSNHSSESTTEKPQRRTKR